MIRQSVLFGAVALAIAFGSACPSETPSTTSTPPAGGEMAAAPEAAAPEAAAPEPAAPEMAGEEPATQEGEPEVDEHAGHDHPPGEHGHDERPEHYPVPEPEMPTEGIGPKIGFRSKAIDLGEVQEGRVPVHVFGFVNEGDQDLVIYRARPSCTCVSVEVGSERVAPGEAGEIVASYNTRGRSGPDRKRIYVDSNDPRAPRVRLVIDIRIKTRPHPSIFLLNRSIDVGVVAPGEKASAETTVKNIGDQDLLVYAVRGPSGASGRLEGASRLPPSVHGTIRFEITAPPRSGVAHFPFVVESNDPFHADFNFGAVAYVPRGGPELRVASETANLGRIAAREGRFDIVLYNRGGEPLVLGGARRQDGDERLRLEVEAGTSVPPAGEAIASIHFDGTGEPGSIRSRWVIESNDARFPERTVDLFADVVEAPPAGRGPRLLLGHEEWLMGEVDSSEAPSHEFTVLNRGDAPLEISGLKSYGEPHPFTLESAGPIPPGGKGKMTVQLSPGQRPGILDHYLEIVSNDETSGAQIAIGGVVRRSERGFPEGTSKIALLFTSDEAGEIQSCGCGAARLGGLDRMTALVQEIRSRGEPVLLVGAGDLFGPNEPHFRLRADLAARSLSLMGCDAVTIGESDLSFGREFLEKTFGEAGIPVVATNLVAPESAGGPENGAAGETRHVKVLRKAAGGLDVAILGLIDPAIFPGGSGFQASDPAEALAEALGPVRGDADLVILLSHLGRDRTVALLERVAGVDVAVIGHAEEELEEPVRVGKSVIVANGASGKRLGLLEVGIAPDGVVHALGRLLDVNEDLAPDPKAKILMENYKRKLRELPAPKAVPLAESPFVGSAQCKDCHPTAFAVWEESLHSHAFASLKAVASDYDPECVGCHVVGHEQEGGFVRADVTPDRVDVGCETCHGPGRAHVEAREAGKEDTYQAPNIRGMCGTCHTQDRNPGFRFDEFWKKIEHGKE